MNTKPSKEESNSGYSQYKENRIENRKVVNRRIIR